MPSAPSGILSVPVEHEVKLTFPNVDEARRAVASAGGQLSTARRLLDDQLFDTADAALRRSRTALRIRRDGDRGLVTWKGPIQSGLVKSREEIETEVDDPRVLQAVLEALGFRPVFRAQKFREEYALGGTTVVIDDTPMGVFVEIEGPPERIAPVAGLLGRHDTDFVLESYPALWRRWCDAHGADMGDMIFDPLPR